MDPLEVGALALLQSRLLAEVERVSETVASGAAKDWAGYLQMVGKREGLLLAASMLGDLIEEDRRGRL
jgi:uncharacterized membrane protein (UPF0136 family)